MDELETLIDQLDEILSEGVDDGEDAIELAIVAGTAARLGASAEVLADAVAFRDGAGQAFLREAWEQVDLERILELIEAGSTGDLEEDDLEEVVLDLDDLIAAAVWCGRQDRMRPAAAKVARMVRDLPDFFSGFAAYGEQTLALPAVAADLDLYDVWVAIAEAGAWAND